MQVNQWESEVSLGSHKNSRTQALGHGLQLHTTLVLSSSALLLVPPGSVLLALGTDCQHS